MPNEPIDILFGGAYSIKAYYEESGNPKQMRGASDLLLDVFETRIPKLIESESALFDGTRYPYYTGGSQLFAVLKPNTGDVLLPQIEQDIQKTCQTAHFSIIVQKSSTDEIEFNYPDLIDRLAAASYGKRMAYIPDFTSQDAKDDSLLAYDYVAAIPVDEGSSDTEGRKHCVRCRNRPAHYRVGITQWGEEPSEYLNLCTACSKKEIRGRLKYPERKRDGRDITQMVNLADGNGDVALLYADINNLGGIGSNIPTFPERIRFFRDIDEAVRTALEETERRIGATYQRIACGGDDVCLLLPGESALYAAVHLASSFETLWKCSQQNVQNPKDVHLSVGVTISDSKTAIDTFHDMTEQLVKSAKKRSRAETIVGRPQPCLDIYRLGGDGQYSTDLDRLRAYGDPSHPYYVPGDVRLTLFPMTALEGRRFMDILKASQNVSASRLRNIVDGTKRKSLIEGELYFQFLCARHRDDEAFRALAERIHALLANKADKPRLYYKVNRNGVECVVSPWHDILALSTQKAGDARE